MNHAHPSVSRASSHRIAGIVVAGIFVAGATTWLTLGGMPGAGEPSRDTPARAPGYLHAPATDPSLPAADQVFVTRHASDEPSSPTF